ncbi:hypothetical protein TRAPUB_6487 [Trametes pubescens]|uniref:Uncharacterized protein n=1 Tax=Trametes pubescens TaxID=154538 RepID=A0A1M2V5S9_TRAPU|nr:hypothetical protein TRAPUB_6487 [Trametes pubescens]
MSDAGSKTQFDLDISGVAGFFGGDVSVSAMATVHIYEGRKWLGWYNQPGSYEIAKRYGQLSRSRFWDALYPGVNVDPAVLFEYDGGDGPKFTATQSGTVLPKTGHVANLFADECSDLDPVHLPPDIVMRKTSPGFVTIAKLDYAPSTNDITRKNGIFTSILASIPIIVSLGACVGCAFIRDWYCFAIILLGVISSGLSCYVIGLGTLRFKHPPPARGAPPGDGVLENGGSELIIMKGPEGAINAVTRGNSRSTTTASQSTTALGAFVVQLLLIPQSSLHGQLLFLATLACAWAYNSYLASFDRAGIQRAILSEQVLKLKEGQLKRYRLGTRTAMVTFALLLLAPAPEDAIRRVLNDLLPNDTEVWRRWKSEVLTRIAAQFPPEGSECATEFSFGFPQEVPPPESDRPEDLLQTLYNDATSGAAVYNFYQG